MKTISRLCFGLLSSLFLAIGMVRAAERLDPVTQTSKVTADDVQQHASALPCTLPCDVDELS